jgi:hypothetical protein
MGMIRCGIVEDNEAMLACFFGGLNKEIQHILDYKEYNTITCLFHLACKAELEVLDHQPSWRRANNSAGRTSSRSVRQSDPPSRGDCRKKNSVSDQQMVMEQEQVAFLMWAWYTWRWMSLVAQRVLSVQLSKAEHDQCHNLFQTRG